MHWSSRKLAAEVGDASFAVVQRIWLKHGLKPHRLVDAGIRDHLRHEGWRHALGELHPRPQPLRADFLDVFSDRWHGVPVVLHGLERDQKNVDRHLKLQHLDTVARQHEDGSQQVGLLNVDLVSQLNLLLSAHAVDVDVRPEHHGLREQGHDAASNAGCQPRDNLGS